MNYTTNISIINAVYDLARFAIKTHDDGTAVEVAANNCIDRIKAAVEEGEYRPPFPGPSRIGSIDAEMQAARATLHTTDRDLALDGAAAKVEAAIGGGE